jgi:phosphoadenosine phosphosulfate reductase
MIILQRTDSAVKSLHYFQSHIEKFNAPRIVSWALETFGVKRIALASSFSIEDQALTHMLVGLDQHVRIFTLDTGRLFEQTFDTMQKTRDKYGISYEVCAPEAPELSAMVSEYGPCLFYESVGNRKLCCGVRKVKPLTKVLKTVDAWICGLRRDQSVTRTVVGPVEWDEQFSIYKINPLYDWSDAAVWDYVKKNDVPYNRLYDEGFKSIGCAPCTRAIKEGEDVRAGRWWWEEPEHKECGLHTKRNNP